MPDTRKLLTAVPPGFGVGQGRMNETTRNQPTVNPGDNFVYTYHVTLESWIGSIGFKQKGMKISSFHVSFYYGNVKWGLISWAYSAGSDSYEVKDYVGLCAEAATRAILCTRAIKRVRNMCKFGCGIANPAYLVAPAPVAVAVAVPALPVIGAFAPVVVAKPAVAPAVAEQEAPGAPVVVAGPAQLGNFPIVPPAPVVQLVQNGM